MARLDIEKFKAETDRMRVESDAETKAGQAETAASVKAYEADVRADAARDVASVKVLSDLQQAGMTPLPQLQDELDE